MFLGDWCVGEEVKGPRTASEKTGWDRNVPVLVLLAASSLTASLLCQRVKPQGDVWETGKPLDSSGDDLEIGAYGV